MSLEAQPETRVLLPLERHTLAAVDDDPSTLSALERLLRRDGYELRATTRPREALDWVASGVVSLVLCDLRMPEMSGLRFIETAYALAPETSLVLLTAYGDPLPPSLPAREVVGKPWIDRELLRTVRLLLRERELRFPRG